MKYRIIFLGPYNNLPAFLVGTTPEGKPLIRRWSTQPPKPASPAARALMASVLSIF